jgi:hypothetical protein
MRQTILEFDDGAVSHSLIKVKLEDLEEWDATHDAAGKLLVSGTTTEDFGPKEDSEIKV